MEENAKLIETVLGNIGQYRLPTYEDWINDLVHVKNQECATALLSVGLEPCCPWRVLTVNLLLDLMDHPSPQGGMGILEPGQRSDRQPLSALKSKAADLIVFNYLKDDPESRGVEWCRWSQDFEASPELFGKILRTLHAHRFDNYMNDGRHPESVIKRFLKRCSTAYLWSDRKFDGVKNTYLVDLYTALLGYRMSDLVTRSDDVSLEALRTIVLGSADERPKSQELMQKRIQEALISGSTQDAAKCLVVMTAVRAALDLEREKQRVERQIQELESKRRDLAGAP